MLVQSLSLKLAGELGGIGQFEIERAPGRAAGNVCVLKAGIPSISQGETSIRAAQRCLRGTVDWDRPGAEVLATLARTQLALDPSDTDGPLGLANQAVAMAPLSARANTALMVAQFLSGRPEAAIEAGRRAQALNPGSPKVAAKLATVMFAAGLVEEGVALAGEARAPSNRRRGKQRWFLRSTHIARMVDGLPPCRTGELRRPSRQGVAGRVPRSAWISAGPREPRRSQALPPRIRADVQPEDPGETLQDRRRRRP